LRQAQRHTQSGEAHRWQVGDQVVGRGLASEVTSVAGDADVTITTTAPALALARRANSPGLDAVVAGRAADRKLALQAIGLQLSSSARR